MMRSGKVNYWLLVLIGGLGIGLFLRFYNLGAWLRFTGDEARDAIAAYEIVQGVNFPIEGPKIHIGFGFLGPAYYYLLALPLWMSGGDPAAAGWLAALFDVAAAVMLYFLTRKLWGRNVALLSTLLYALSFQVVFYARWGWHPSLVPFFVLLVLYGSLHIADGESRWGPATIFAFSIALQLHLTVIVLILPLLIAFWIGRRRLTPFIILFGLIIGTLPFLPLIRYELVNGYPNFRGALDLFSFQQESTWESPLGYLISSLSPIASLDVVHKSIQLLPGGGLVELLNGLLFAFGLLMLVLDGVAKRYRGILAGWFLLPVLALVAYSGFRPDYYLISWFCVPLIVVAYGLVSIWERFELRGLAFGLVILICGVNLAAATAYFQLMGRAESVYSFYHGVPLDQKEALVEALLEATGDASYDLTVVTWAWPNYQPYIYLLELEAGQPRSLDLFESADGESGPFTPHSIPYPEARLSDEEPFRGRLIIKEPDTLPLPPPFAGATKIGEFGGAGLYLIQ